MRGEEEKKKGAEEMDEIFNEERKGRRAVEMDRR